MMKISENYIKKDELIALLAPIFDIDDIQEIKAIIRNIMAKCIYSD